MVQRELARRDSGRNRHSGVHVFSGRVKCGQCGSWYGSKVWHSNSKYRQVIWQCNHKFDNEEKCSTPHFTDEELQAFFISAVKKLLEARSDIISAFSEIKDAALDTSALETEQAELEAEVNIASELMQQCIYENAHVSLDQTEYQKRYDALSQRFDSAQAKRDIIKAQIADKVTRRATIEEFLKEPRSLEGPVTEFDADRFSRLVNYYTVHSKDDVRVTFKNGTEIKA